MATKESMAEVHSVMILLNNLRLLLAAHDMRSGLREQVSWFCEQLEVMFGFLLVYYSEDGSNSDHHLAAGPSSDQEMSKVVEMIRDFAVEYGDVVVDAFDEIMAKQPHTTTADEDEDEDDESLQLARNDNPAAALGREQIKSIVSLILTYNSDEYYRNVCKKDAEAVRVTTAKRSHRSVGQADFHCQTDFSSSKFHLGLLSRRLTRPETDQLNVIAITGEGGTGKTSLAKILYKIFRDLDFSGWMSVSKTYVLRDLMLSLLKDVMVSTENIIDDMDVRQLRNEIRKQLKDRRYLIVVDDVWDTQTWDKLKHLFPDDSNGSIIITTRFPSVASHATGSDIEPFPLSEYFVQLNDNLDNFYDSKGIWQYDCFELKSLDQVQSWMLFCELYFREPHMCLCVLNYGDDGMEAQGRRIVRSCRGRPLVISVVAHILRAIDGGYGSSWSSIAGQINDQRLSGGDYDRQMDILTLCFRKLPQQLQSCFLYLGGLFPKNTEIELKQVIQLWVAEGLIGLPPHLVNNANGTMEDAAEYYLEELDGLCLIQVSRDRSDGGAKACFIHDILRDFCLRLSKEEGFMEVHTGGDHTNTSSTGGADQIKPKILSILGNCREYLSEAIKSSSSDSACSPVRSFSSFNQDTQSFSEEDWRSLFQHFRWLRVLNLGDQEAQDEIDDSIRDLTHLRYLKVKPAKSIPVPIAAIFNLWNLQTIDLRKSSFFDELPVEIWKMLQLRHLYLGGSSTFPEAESDDHLPNLLTLSYISNDSSYAIPLAEKAPNLRKLGLTDYRCESEAEQEATFSLQHLQSLKFKGECTFTETIALPATITKITVKAAVLQPNVLEMFGKLPKLLILKLVQINFENNEWMVPGKNSFPRLKLLKLANSDIVSWKLEKGAMPMPMLCHLVISCCSQLSELPTELYQNSAFQELRLDSPSQKLANKLVEELKESGKRPLLSIYPPIQGITELLSKAGRIDRDLLDIYPTEVKFPFELNKRSSCSIELVNNTNQFVAFVIETASEKYGANPCNGIVFPRKTCDVTFTMEAQKEALISMESKDHFSIQSSAVPHGTTAEDVTPDMFNLNHELGEVVNEFKLPVIYVPANPLKPVREESSSRASVPEYGNRS